MISGSLLSGKYRSIDDLSSAINRVLAALYGRLGKVSREDTVVAVSDATANQPFVIPHGLGSVPTTFTYVGWGAGVLTATDDDRKRWTSSQIVARCTTVSTKFDVTVKA